MEGHSQFEGTMTLDSLKLMQEDGPDFRFVQAVCVSKVESHRFRDGDWFSVLAHPAAVRWILFFRAVRWEDEYFPKTDTIDPSRRDVFFCFSSTISSARDGTPVQAVPYLEKLHLLSPQPGDRLVLLRTNKRYDRRGRSVLIRPGSVLEVETVFASEVYVRDERPSEDTEYTVEIMV